MFLHKLMKIARISLLSLFVLAAIPGRADEAADVPSEDLRAGKDDNKRYFLIGPRKDARTPRRGFGLVVILPGGPGGAEFHPFVKRLFKEAIPDGYLVVQPVAVHWTPKPAIVWPSEKRRAEKMKFTTETFVAEIIKEVKAKHKIDPKKVFTLSWSSSGPAAYAISMTDKSVAGSFIAMSVFKPEQLPSLEKARGHVYYLYHSPDDAVCPYRMARQASRELKKNGATVKLQTYTGKHGWTDSLYLQHIREGIIWLEKNSTASGKK
jgi:predicted esterase